MTAAWGRCFLIERPPTGRRERLWTGWTGRVCDDGVFIDQIDAMARWHTG